MKPRLSALLPCFSAFPLGPVPSGFPKSLSATSTSALPTVIFQTLPAACLSERLIPLISLLLHNHVESERI